MKRSDWALLALNASTAFMAFAGAVEGDEDFAVLTFFLVSLTLAINSTVLVRRARQRDDAPARRDRRRAADDEMDARTILDFDARLEALERAYSDAADAAKWRALVQSGQVSGPAAEAPLADEAGRQPLNGRS